MRLLAAPVLHTSDRPSATAQAVTIQRALELQRPAADRIVSDEYAPTFLSRGSRRVLAALAAGLPVVDVAERNSLTGLTTYVLCRHRFIDEHLVASLAGGAEQVVILGAGYDSRAYRFASALDGRPVYEVDLPPLSRQKAKIVAAHPDVFGRTSIVRVEIDFRTQRLADRLQVAGFRPGLSTFVAWEGVIPYLDEPAITATLGTVASLCAPGSRIAMDIWAGGQGTGPRAVFQRASARALALIGEPVTFALLPADLDGFLGARGFAAVDVADSGELTSRYATLGRVAAESIYVVAAEVAAGVTGSR